VRTPPQPPSGAPRRDLIANQRGRATLSSSANTAANHGDASRTPATIRRCLTDDDRPRYPATAFTSPTERAGAPLKPAFRADDRHFQPRTGPL
jgi:hypothetical protein